MTSSRGLILLAMILTFSISDGVQSSIQKPAAAFTFSGVKYFHRFTKGDLHEYTPAGQEDLSKFKDMVTINVYPTVKDGDALASSANSVLETYKANRAVVVRTNSIPRTAEKPAEHFIAVLFPQPKFIEAAFARFKMHNGIGISVVYSHRIYGAKAGPDASAWLKANGPALEKTLMAWNAVPKDLTK